MHFWYTVRAPGVGTNSSCVVDLLWYIAGCNYVSKHLPIIVGMESVRGVLLNALDAIGDAIGERDEFD